MKDYAKKTEYRKRQASLSRPLALLSLVIILALLSILYAYYSRLKNVPSVSYVSYHQQSKKRQHRSHHTQAKIAQPISSSIKNQANFDFYSMLAQQPDHFTSQLKQQPKTGYYLRLSVTPSETGAKRLSTKLGTEGYAAIVEPQLANATTVYWVLLGPYSSIEEAKYNQMQLKALNTTSLIVAAKST